MKIILLFLILMSGIVFAEEVIDKEIIPTEDIMYYTCEGTVSCAGECKNYVNETNCTNFEMIKKEDCPVIKEEAVVVEGQYLSYSESEPSREVISEPKVNIMSFIPYILPLIGIIMIGIGIYLMDKSNRKSFE